MSAQHQAIVAAHLTSDALAELMRFAREGASHTGHLFVEIEPVSMLAEALTIVAEMERESLDPRTWSEERQQLGQLVAGLQKFRSDWNA